VAIHDKEWTGEKRNLHQLPPPLGGWEIMTQGKCARGKSSDTFKLFGTRMLHLK
jgi:hypothetical protein